MKCSNIADQISRDSVSNAASPDYSTTSTAVLQQLTLPIDVPIDAPILFRPIHYLGSKLRFLDRILAEVATIEPTGAPIADLFAGSGTVTAAFSLQRSVTAVDIQEYSRVLCSALLGLSRIDHEDASAFIAAVRSSSLLKSLKAVAQPLIELEQHCIEAALRGDAGPLCELLQYGSVFRLERGAMATVSRPLKAALNETIRRLKMVGLAGSSSATVLRYFGGIYFSYGQAAELDAALDTIRPDSRSRDCLLAAILSTASTVVNTIGKQFAQPIMPVTRAGQPKLHLVRQIRNDRALSVPESLESWLFRYANLPRSNNSHHVIRGDYAEIARGENGKVGIVYADPPYTRDHYSRYYHVLETMCLRDNPEVSRVQGDRGEISRGLYRANRYQSPFCIKTKAPGAFDELFAMVAKLNVPLVLSYSPYRSDVQAHPRMLTVPLLTNLARKHFKYVDVSSAGKIVHNKLNRTALALAALDEAEVFLLCRPR